MIEILFLLLNLSIIYKFNLFLLNSLEIKNLKKVEDDLLDFLSKLNFIFINEYIFTECIKDFDGFSIFNEAFGPFEIGKKYRLKFFIAKIFIENNILKIALNEKCNNIDVQRYAIAERDDQKLIKQENMHFLNKIKEFRFFMDKDTKEGIKPKMDLDRFNSYLSNIIDSRLLKLLRLSKTELTLDDEKRLTNSEQILYKFMFKFINTWRKFFLDTDIVNKN